jgi:Flp pilus assembly protein TadG
MSRWLKMLKKFRSNERGNIALLFGLTLVPVAGAAGVAIDYSSASNMRTALQADVDATALDIIKAAVDIHVDPSNASLTQAQRQALVDTKVTQIVNGRRPISQARMGGNSNFTFTGQWVDTLKTEYQVTASMDVKRHIRVLSSDASTAVSVSATTAMKYDAVLKSAKPEMIRPGFNAGDYNRLYAYCYNKNEPDASKRRTQMTAMTSNGASGGKMEVDDAEILKNAVMPECDVDKGETLSWRLQNVRDSRTNSANWPKDTKGTLTATYYANGAVKWATTYVDGVTTEVVTGGSAVGAIKETKTKEVWRSDDPTTVNGTSTNPQVRGLYNHYSDTLTDANSGLESFQFRGDQMGYNAPINIMETVVCSTKDLCNPDKPGSIVPQGSNRTPTPATTKCEPGKFMFIGFEDRPYVPGRPASDYTTWGSGYWTDRDYEDVTFVISCPSKEITGYTQKIWLRK